MELIKNENVNGEQTLLSNEEIKERAIEKLDKEFSFFLKNGAGHNMVENCIMNVIAEPIKEKLQAFCTDSEDFAISVLQKEQSFSECLKEVVKKLTKNETEKSHNTGFGVSDIDVYSHSVSFYFPDVETKMYISLTLPENYISKGISKETADLVWQQIEATQQEIEQKAKEKTEKEKKEKEEREKRLQEQKAKTIASVPKNEEPKELQLSLF